MKTIERPININDFIEELHHSPKFIGHDLDGVIIVSWPEIDGKSPSLEFGTRLHKRMKEPSGQYIYYEIVDFGNGYKDGEIIPLDDRVRRSDVYPVIPRTLLTRENKSEIVNHINDSLDRFYSGVAGSH